MVYVRSRKRKTGIFHDVVTGRHEKPIPCGPGKAGLEDAQELAAEIRKLRRMRRAGIPIPEPCAWDLRKLREVDLLEARRRGLKTAEPQFQGKQSRRESHWNNLLAFFPPSTSLEAVTAAEIRAYIAKREEEVGPAPINRDLDVLRFALALARDHEEAAFRGDPFAKLRRLREKHRAGVALPLRVVLRLLRDLERVDRKLGTYAALLFWTASRLRQEPAIVEGEIVYPPQKRGTERRFQLTPRLRRLLARPRAFSYRRWYAALEATAVPGVPPDLHPHDLRHTRLTLEGRRPGATLEGLMKLGGTDSPEWAQTYLHPDRHAAIDPESITRKREQSRKLSRKRPADAVRRKLLI